MITVDEALRRVREAAPVGDRVRVSPGYASGMVLAESVEAMRPHPPFDRAAMDGYAVRSSELEGASPERPVRLPVEGTVPAGPATEPEDPSGRGPGRALRILTGAPVPEGTDAVVRQEEVARSEGGAEFTASVRPGTNIRAEGEEVRPGDTLLEAGTLVGPAGSALLLSQGIRSVSVIRRPEPAVVATGDELVPAGSDPGPGCVVDTVSPLLGETLAQEGCAPTLQRAGDDPDELRGVLEELLQEHELVVTVGGVSVGDRDHVRPILGGLGVEEQFWGVSQKPGKPLYFGRHPDGAVLGLPGNPVSAAVCFYVYGLPLLRRMAGLRGAELGLRAVPTVVAAGEVQRRSRPDRTVFLRTRTEDDGSGFRSRVVSRQGSHMLTGLARANSLVRIPPSPHRERGPFRAYLLPTPRPRSPRGRSRPSSYEAREDLTGR